MTVRLDPRTRRAFAGGRSVTLSELQFSLLSALAGKPGTTLSAPSLMREIWGGAGDRRRLEVLASRLRARLHPLGLTITAVPKRGYRLRGVPESA